MGSYEQLGVFYLGRRYDQATKRTTDEPLLYESRDLRTHGLVVGMTGSGKTGLCCDLLEEAAMDGIPSLVIDPKGDMGNLLLMFPDLQPSDFAPWVSPDEARRKGISPEALAEQQARLWREGLAKWDQDGARIRRLREKAEFALYTPGSSAGRGISILSSFAAPPVEIREDLELLNNTVQSTVSSLLGLVGVSGDPTRGREGILLATLFHNAWAKGRALQLTELIREVQEPPIQRVGVVNLDTFFPAKERLELALALNNLLASPSFAAWTEGEPLDIKSLLHDPSGKPRTSVFSIAHLSEKQRMFFVTLLLNRVLNWMRSQPGAGSLRALVYMDEIFGYFPPVANPPSKRPLLTLLKQARAYGVGIVLATQNPSDLDYKGLSNIGTWFIGGLQTQRDKDRVLEGLSNAAGVQGGPFSRAEAKQALASLGKRRFLLHNVHEDAPELFESRWAMSYLCGPLSRAQIKRLCANRRDANGATSAQSHRRGAPRTLPGSDGSSGDNQRPVLPPEVPEFFAPLPDSTPSTADLVYEPRLMGVAQVHYIDGRRKLDYSTDLEILVPVDEGTADPEWDNSEEPAFSYEDLSSEPDNLAFASCPPSTAQPKNYPHWQRSLRTWIRLERPLELLQSPLLKLRSEPGEPEGAFRVRLRDSAREKRDAAAEKLRKRYAKRFDSLRERHRRAEAARQREAEQARRASLDTVISFGSTLLGAFLGRKKLSRTNVSRAATTLRRAGRAADQAGDIGRAQEAIEAIKDQMAALQREFDDEVSELAAILDAADGPLETIRVRARSTNIEVRQVALVWVPA